MPVERRPRWRRSSRGATRAAVEVDRRRRVDGGRLDLADEKSPVSDRLMESLVEFEGRVPTLFWFEARQLFLMAERRGRLHPGEAELSMQQLRGFRLFDAGVGFDSEILALARSHALSADDAAYLHLAKTGGAALATLDRRLGAAALQERIPLLGPLAP